jgi:pimeloyl-ACP methyl ester carboxylesterase
MLRKTVITLTVLLALAAAVVIRPDLSIEEVQAEYQRPFSKFATLRDGTKLHYWERGSASSPALVLLHGVFDSADTWEEWAPQLEKDFHLIVPDLPAHGLTGKTISDDYSADAMAGAVHELIDQLKLERVSIAGNSMGGRVAWVYTAAHPERVQRLVLIDPSGYPNKNSVTPTASNPVMSWLLRYGNPKRLVRQGFVRAVGESDEALISDLRVDRWTAYVRRQGTRDAQRKRAAQHANLPSGQPRIARIQAPTLVLWGDQDALIPVQHAGFFSRDLPNDTLIIYEGVGHMPQLEIPERSAHDARAFLLRQL